MKKLSHAELLRTITLWKQLARLQATEIQQLKGAVNDKKQKFA